MLKILNYLPLVIILLLVLFLPYWIIKNPYPLTSIKPEIMGSDTANYVKNLEGDGIMTIYVPITYFTNKREITLHPVPEKLDFFIELYDINYLAFYLNENNPYLDPYKKTFEYIFKHPEKYKLLKIIKENYHPNNNYGSVEIPKNNNQFYIFMVK